MTTEENDSASVPTLELLRVAATENLRLRRWIEGDAFCPCCETIVECGSACTFKADDPSGWVRMAQAREVLRGGQ